MKIVAGVGLPFSRSSFEGRKFVLSVDNSSLVVIDVQEKLSRVIYQRERLIDNLQRLIKGAQVLGIPVVVTEQYPEGLGLTIPEVSELLPGMQPLPKISFSCCGDDRFLKALKGLGRDQLLISGIETHVCVYQTVRDLVGLGYKVHAVTDTISSRTAENRETGLGLMGRMGVSLTSTETVLFELLRKAGGDKFKAISRIVK